MYLNKTPHPANFAFAPLSGGRFEIDGRRYRLRKRAFEGGVYHLAVEGPPAWKLNLCLEPVTPPPAVASGTGLEVGDGLRVSRGRRTLLESAPGKAFGVCGEASIFCFQIPKSAHFYGLGEKSLDRFEMSGVWTKFWNTDVAGDFPFEVWRDRPADPFYSSVPYVAVETGGVFVGLLMDNPYPTFVDTGVKPWFPTGDVELSGDRLVLGAEGGRPSLWIIVGPTLRELTAKLQKLVGVVPTPPLWALGYHQCRWGYKGEADLRELDAKFREHKFPCDALWLDIDYMDGYRVFTVDEKHFPRGVQKAAAELAKHGRRIVPILDPGVKLDPYPAYEDGKRADVFCKNPQGRDFVGLVWPGRTVFPDLSMAEGRDFWRRHSKAFRQSGFGGAWVDMNDPATGPVDPHAMLFDRGRLPHAAHRNQYALGMQMATRAGFLDAEPDERPFLLSRSAFVGTSRHSAVWTGDSYSNRFHLRGSLLTCLNMSLSGLPFVGPDLGGFMGECDDALMLDWVRACFLFPVCRNHAMMASNRREPWAFGADALSELRDLIRLRYRLLPYLYNLFAAHEESGEPVLRPLLYEFPERRLAKTGDAFMVGPHLLQIPFLAPGATRRGVLPGTQPWFDLSAGVWTPAGPRRLVRSDSSTPIFARNGAIVPMRPGVPEDARTDLANVEFHVFLAEGDASTEYVWDDGLSFAYRRGERSRLAVRARLEGEAVLVETQTLADGFGKGRFSVVVTSPAREIVVNGSPVKAEQVKVRWTGSEIPALRASIG